MQEDVFYGEKLRFARLLNGLTLQQLGDYVSASRQFIHQLEGDLRPPPSDLLLALCEVLSVKREFFFTRPGNDVKFEHCHFRKRKTTAVSLANRVCAYSTIFEQLVEFMSSYLDLPEINFPEIKASSENYSNLDIETAAESCRQLWKLETNTPIKNITRALENAGVVITTFSGVSEKVDALSLNRKHPIIIRNDAKDSPGRLRFDLAHECGHFVLHNGVETGDSVTESEADKFASAFLFPRAAFVKEFPKTFKPTYESSWQPIYALKVRWGMSAKAIIYRAHYLGLISSQAYRAANVWLSKTGQAKKERYDDKMMKETPELLEKSIGLMSDHLGLSFPKIASRLNITTTMLSTITGMHYPEEECDLGAEQSALLDNIEPIF